MHSATLALGRQLDMLFSLYELALDLCNSLTLQEPELLNKRLTERQRLLRKTEAIAAEAQQALRAFETLAVPANEKALIAEKRQIVLDLLGRMCEAENTVLKAMHGHMVGVRHELVRMDSNKKAISAYAKSPAFA